MKDSPVIKDRNDARWLLAVAEELTVELPIDQEVERLGDLGVLHSDDDTKKLVRKSVYAALREAYDGPAHAKQKQLSRKATPDFWHALLVRTNSMLDAYSEIEASLEGHNVHVALHFVKEALAERLPTDRQDAGIRYYTDALRDFHNAAFALFHFREVLEIATAEVAPKLGRPAVAMYYFVRSLGLVWFKLSGNIPTRHFDAFKEAETGPFYSFCAAAAETVEVLLPSGSVDAAVRKVTDEWKLRVPPEEI